MFFKSQAGLFEPVFAAIIAGVTSYSSSGEVYKALGLALIGGGLGWLGKIIVQSIFYWVKKKITGK